MAQLIPLLVSPLLTRLYTPSAFGVFSIVLSATTFGAIAVTGRYEVAIILPGKEEIASRLSIGSLLISTASCLGIFIVALFFGPAIASGLGLPTSDQYWIYWIPLFIFLAATFQIMNYTVNKQGNFDLLAKNRVGRSLSLSAVQLGMGYFSLSSGLVVGQVLGTAFAAIYLSLRQKWNLFAHTIKDIKAALWEYRKFPVFSFPADSLNSFSNQAPIILIALFFTEREAGFYGLTLRVLSLPIALIAQSILDVFKQKAADDYAMQGNCISIYRRTFKTLILLAVPAFLLLYFIAPPLFSWFFGAEWKDSGFYAQILSIMFLFRFVASPLSYTLYIAEKQHIDLIWQFFLAAVTICAFYFGSKYGDIYTALWLFSMSYAVLYLVYLILSYNFAKGKIKL